MSAAGTDLLPDAPRIDMPHYVRTPAGAYELYAEDRTWLMTIHGPKGCGADWRLTYQDLADVIDGVLERGARPLDVKAQRLRAAKIGRLPERRVLPACSIEVACLPPRDLER